MTVQPMRSRVILQILIAPTTKKLSPSLKKGKERLLTTPLADMSGIKPSEKQKVQPDKYMQRLEIEANTQKVINEENLVYDEENL